MLFENKNDGAGPSFVCGVRYFEVMERPRAPHATQTIKAFLQSSFNDEAVPPVQQPSSTPLFGVQSLDTDLSSVGTNLAKLLERSNRKLR